MPRLLRRKYTTMKDIEMSRATCGLLIIVPVQCIIEKKIIRERIDISGSVASDLIPERVEEESMLLKLLLVQQKNEDFLNDKSLHIAASGGILRKLISSLTRGSHAHWFFLVFHNPCKVVAVIALTIPCMRLMRPISGLLKGSEDDSHSLPGSEWSSLPFLLLWMIQDRLDFFNNAKVALVCCHWWHGSRNNPTKMQTVGDGIPWIMLNASAKGNTWVREFINFERTKKFTIEVPEFYKSHLLFSSRGWILFGRNNFRTKDLMVDSLFLINPLTKGKIEVGDIVIGNGEDNKISLYITYPGGDQVWTERSYVVEGFTLLGNCGLTVINSIVYMFCEGGAMIMYDMGERTWKVIPGPLPELEITTFQFMEHEGNVGLFRWWLGERWLFKYSHTHNCWQRLSNDDETSNNMSIFGRQYSTYLTARIQKGLNVYEIGRDHGNVCLYNIDYMSGKKTSLLLHSAGASWVYIG